MSIPAEVFKLAETVMKPMVSEVAAWIHGDGERRPKVLSMLPNELQSEIALKRLEARYARGLQIRPETKVAKPSIELPPQKSDLRVTLGPKPGEG